MANHMQFTALQREKEKQSRVYSGRIQVMEEQFNKRIDQMQRDHQHKVLIDEEKYKELTKAKEDQKLQIQDEIDKSEIIHHRNMEQIKKAGEKEKFQHKQWEKWLQGRIQWIKDT